MTTMVTNDVGVPRHCCESVQKKLDYFFTTKQIPHIIFHGASGTGKRTILHNFLHKIYEGDKHKLKTNVMSVNCAHGKGIKFIRDDLKNFAKTNVQSNSGVLFKSIVLYNADFLTIDAQSALRRCIEIFSHNTRFFIVVENKHKLFNPILSRFCEIFIPEVMLEGIVSDDSFCNPVGMTQINLHTEKLRRAHPISVELAIRESEILELYHISKSDPHSLNDKIVAATSRFYERGCSAQDVMDVIRTMSIFDESRRVGIMVCFHKVRSEFRNEKMLMFYILDFAFLRSNASLKNISFI